MKILALEKVFILLMFVSFCIYAEESAMAIEDGPNKNQNSLFREIRLGVLLHDVDGLWSNARKEHGIDYNVEIVMRKPTFFLLGGNIRPNIGLSVNDSGGTSKIYGGFLWEIKGKSNLFVNMGLGLAIHDGELDTNREDRKELGSRFLFRVPVEFGVIVKERHSISVLFDHISNGYLKEPNEGLDTLGLRYGYRF